MRVYGYADAISLLCPTVSGMKEMLKHAKLLQNSMTFYLAHLKASYFSLVRV